MSEMVWFLLWLHPLIYSEFFKNYHVFDLCDLEIKVGVIHLGDVTLTHQGPLIPKISCIWHASNMENWVCHGIFHGWSIYGSSLNHGKESSDRADIFIRPAAISQVYGKIISAKSVRRFLRFRTRKFIQKLAIICSKMLHFWRNFAWWFRPLGTCFAKVWRL